MDKTVPFGKTFHVGLYNNGQITELEGYDNLKDAFKTSSALNALLGNRIHREVEATKAKENLSLVDKRVFFVVY